jgi:hypothetical protein
MTGEIDELFRNWLALVEAMHSKDDDEADRPYRQNDRARTCDPRRGRRDGR